MTDVKAAITIQKEPFTRIENFSYSDDHEIHVAFKHDDKIIVYEYCSEYYEHNSRALIIENEEEYFEYIKKTPWVSRNIPVYHPYFKWLNKGITTKEVVERLFVDYILEIFSGTGNKVQVISSTNEWKFEEPKPDSNAIIHPISGDTERWVELGRPETFQHITLPVYEVTVVVLDKNTAPFIPDTDGGTINALSYFFQVIPGFGFEDISIISGAIKKSYLLKDYDLDSVCKIHATKPIYVDPDLGK